MILVQSIGSQWSPPVELLLLPDPVNIQKNVKFKTVDLSLTESFLFFFLFFLQVQQQKSQLPVHAYIFMQAKLHSMLKDSHYAHNTESRGN